MKSKASAEANAPLLSLRRRLAINLTAFLLLGLVALFEIVAHGASEWWIVLGSDCIGILVVLLGLRVIRARLELAIQHDDETKEGR